MGSKWYTLSLFESGAPMFIYPFTVDAPRAPRAQRLLEDERGIVDDRSFWEVILRSTGGGLNQR
eukprot:scaffold51974_cov74-Phaeocystis_antarctica.AAC.2